MLILKWLAVLGILAFAGLMVYVRMAPIDRVALESMPAELQPGDRTGMGDFVSVRAITDTPDAVVAAVDAVIMATPRTQRISSVDGTAVYETRSALIGFPDYTTVKVLDGDDGTPHLMIYSRVRFGKADLGVNAARAQGWLAALGPLTRAP